MMMTPLERITERVCRHGDVNDPGTPRPLLTLQEFFEGNEVIGSIGCNLTPPPTPAQFWELLERLAARPDVADIRVQVTLFDDPDWPFSDTIWIITPAAAGEVESWFPHGLRPDACSQGWHADLPLEPCPVPVGMHPVACWWD